VATPSNDPLVPLPSSFGSVPAGLPVANIRLENSVIKGYHHYQIRPPMTQPKTLLSVDREYTNIHDLDACLVWIPPLTQFNTQLHDMVTDATRELTLRDIAALPLGHVPRGLAGSFRSILDDGGSVFAEPTGEPVPSFPPWPAPMSKGGGVVIPCTYIIQHHDESFILTSLRSALKDMSEGTAMKLVVEMPL
jgi:hypothetical protein